MQNQPRLMWIGLIIVISCGLAIEAMKSTRFSGDSNWRPKLFGMQDFEDGEDTLSARRRSPKSNDQAQRARSRLLRGRIAGLSGMPAAMTPATQVAVIAPNPTTANLANPNSINADEAKKRAEDAKKKKKKKKKKSATEPQVETAPAANPDSASNDKAKNSGSAMARSANFGGGGVMQANLFNGGAAAMNENPKTLEEWMKYILREPSYDRTMKMVDAQQSRSIDSEIFHEVVSEMLADSRTKMHEYAILALGASPGLESFLLLQAANLAQPEGSQLKIQARNHLKAYSKLENLRYLGAIISTDTNSSTAYEALRLIQIAVTTYKKKPSEAPANGPTTSSLVTRQFTPLVAILTRVANTASDDAVRQEASQTLQQVNSLIGTPATPAV